MPMSRLRLLFATVLVSLALAVPLGANAAAPTTSGVTTPISGTIAGVSQFVGNFTLTRFTVQNGQLAAVGTLTGTLTNLATGATQSVNQTLTLPVAASGTCQVLHLELGPLDLNLLGLQVHLDRVVLDITAQQGPGNLLGNLLCGIAGLLDGGSPLSALTTVLNQLLRLL
jgi:hypothetical protein